MSDVAEGIGGAIEGALLGGAVEPQDGGASGAPHEPNDCPNCGATVTANYCPQCGQKRHIHRSLSAIGHDLIHGVLHLDGKFWNTIPLLAFKPGKLTRRYIDGERAKFVSPMAMFLFSVFAMFAVFQMVGLSVPADLEGGVDLGEAAEFMRDQGESELAELNTRLEAMPADDPRRSELERDIAMIEKNLLELEQNNSIKISDNGTASFEPTGIKFIDEGIVKKWSNNPSLMLYKLQANAYKFSWLLIPLSIPFVWLLFVWKRRFKAYDHAMFVTYSLSFMSMLFIAVSLVAVSPLDGQGGLAFTLLATLAPLHLYKHLRHTYELSRFSTIWRFLVLLVFIVIVAVLFLQALIVLGGF